VGKIEDIDYVQFCGGPRPDWETLGLNPGSNTASRITANVSGVFLFLPFSTPRPPLVTGQEERKKLMDHIILGGAMMWVLQELRGIIEESTKKPVRILDVRPKIEFGICHLPLSIRTSSLPDSPSGVSNSNTLARSHG
jgi:hypothetical protein